MRKFLGILCMLLGLAMMVGAGWLFFGNHTEEEQAGEASMGVLAEMKDIIAAEPKATRAPNESTAQTASTPAPESADVEKDVLPESTSIEQGDDIDADFAEDMLIAEDEMLAPTPYPSEMPTMDIDGQTYIGYLEIPTIGVTLPVMSDWSYPKLRIAPCRYWGTIYDGSLVIMAHNYERHFGRISSLNLGDPVQFVDAEGNIYRYVVAAQETLERRDMRRMIDNEYDLTLFTCTYGGAKRITVRLKSVLTY